MDCPACSHKKHNVIKESSLFECAACGAIYGQCYLGESYEYVLPYMTNREVPAEQIRYFDFITLGSEGVGRRHGWYDPASKRIVQTG